MELIWDGEDGVSRQAGLWSREHDLECLRARLEQAEAVIDAAAGALDRFRIIPKAGWPHGLTAFFELYDRWEATR